MFFEARKDLAGLGFMGKEKNKKRCLGKATRDLAIVWGEVYTVHSHYKVRKLYIYT